MTETEVTDILSCWSCQGPVPRTASLCGTCNSIQPPQGINPFDLLGQPPVYDINTDILELEYFDRQRVLHPDRLSGRTPREREYAMLQTANLNEAYAVLRSRVRRAESLLACLGHPLGKLGEETFSDEEILIQAMELRQQLSESKSAKDMDVVIASCDSHLSRCVAALTNAFSAGDLVMAKRLTVQLTYLEKCSADARERQGSLAVT